MFLQNQQGFHSNKWDRSGLVVESTGNNQYRVKVDRSQRLTLRNRRFLQVYTPTIANELQPAMTSPPPYSMLGPGISQAAPAPCEDSTCNISPLPPTTIKLHPTQIPMLDPPLDMADSGAAIQEPHSPSFRLNTAARTVNSDHRNYTNPRQADG